MYAQRRSMPDQTRHRRRRTGLLLSAKAAGAESGIQMNR